jgi:hypothetical protein
MPTTVLEAPVPARVLEPFSPADEPQCRHHAPYQPIAVMEVQNIDFETEGQAINRRRIGKPAPRRRTKEGSMHQKKHGPQSKELKLDKAVRQILGEKERDYPAADRQTLRERLRLPTLHGGKYVAFRDHFEPKEDSRRLVWREVLRESSNLIAINKFVSSLSPTERSGVHVDFVELASVLQCGR